MELDEVIENIYDNYPKNSLIYIGSLMGLEDLKKLNKTDLVQVVVKALDNKTLFGKLYKSVSPEARKVIDYLTWYGASNLRNIESFYKIKVTNGDFYGNSDDPFIKAIKSTYSRDIFLSSGLRYIFKKYIDPPIGYEINYLENIEANGNYKEIEADDSVLGKLSTLQSFIEQEGIVERGLEKKLLKKVVNKALETINIQEPFVGFKGFDSNIYTIRNTTLLKFLSMSEFIEATEPVDFFIELIKQYKSGVIDQDLNIDSILFFPFVKGAKSNFNINMFLKRGRYAVIDLIKSLIPGKWVTIGNIVQSLTLKEETEIFNTVYFGESFSVKVDYELLPAYHYGDLELLDKRDLQNYLIIPLVKGIVMFLHSIGAVDIVASESGIKTKQKAESSYLTPYDLITAIKLTQLGLKLFGRPSTYQYKTNSNLEYEFLEDKTIILISGNDPNIENFFSRIGIKIGKNDYFITPISFIKECSTHKDVMYNIGRLEGYLNCKNTKVWQDLINQVESRINPIYNEQELIVVNLPLENTSFIDEVINNPSLNSLYYMVEGGKIAFEKENYNKFKKIMKKNGYLI